MKISGTIIAPSLLPIWREKVRNLKRRLVVTNGCFDILHAGHLRYLREARSKGHLLLVGLNGDNSVRELKGPSRPVNTETDRAELLVALRCVDAVCIFPETRATKFLKAAMPDIYVKGGDYTLESLNAEERSAIESIGAQIIFLPFTEGRSTTQILSRSTVPTE